MDKAVGFIDTLSKFRNEKHQQLVMQLTGVALVSTVIYTSYRLIAGTEKRPQRFKEIPVPGSSYPYVGHMFSLGDLPGNTIAKWHAELGPILKLQMGTQTWIMVDDPELAHKIFVTNGADVSHRPEFVFNFKYHGFNGKTERFTKACVTINRGISFAQPGPALKQSRSAALTLLTPKVIVENYMDLIKQESQDLVSRFIENSESEGSTWPLKYLELNTMNIICSACFGKKFDSVDDPEFINLSMIVEKSIELGGVDNDLPNFLPILSIFEVFAGNKAKMKKFVETIRNPTFTTIIQDAINHDEPNVINSLEENGFSFSEEEKLVFAADLVIAGTDTVAITMLWNFAVMCNYPEVQRKVTAEIDKFVELNGRLPEFSERTELPYCISVLKECMRFKPTSPFGVPHVVRKDVIVDDYIIPKGASVMANMKSIHKQPKFYSNPHEFNPERYISNLKTMHSAANGKWEERDHFNFGFGRRICPGIYMAEIEMFHAFIQVFARTHIEPINTMPDIENGINVGLTLSPLPYKVRFVKRQTSLLNVQ